MKNKTVFHEDDLNDNEKNYFEDSNFEINGNTMVVKDG